MAPIPPPSIHLPPQDPFRNAYLGSWQGEGKINIDPKNKLRISENDH